MTAAVPLAPGYLACRGCGQGVAVTTESLIEPVSAFAAWVNGPVPLLKNTPERQTMLARCPDCVMLRAHALDLLTEHPALRDAIGSESVGVHRLGSALTALDVIGQQPPTIRDDRDLFELIDRLAPLGSAVMWSGRFAPIVMLDADPDECAATRWAHVTDEQRQEVCDTLAALMHDRIDVLRPIVPPEGAPRGCLLCGLGTVDAMTRDAHAAWIPLTAPTDALGGRMSPEPISGYLCPVCASAVESAGAIGPSAMEGSVRAHFGVVREFAMQGRADLVGWGVLPPRAPNATPWHHIHNLDEITRYLR